MFSIDPGFDLAQSDPFPAFSHAVTAHRRTPISVTRLYTGSDGETHAEEIVDKRLTPDAARNGLEASDVIKVSGLQFARTAPR